MGRRKLTTEEFIKNAQEIHGDKYDYSLVQYENAKTPVTIICPIHGKFLMRPANHINQKQGCPKCGKLKAAETQSLTTEEFIKKAKEVHGDKYDYSKVNYTRNYQKVCIVCPEHGEFWQSPHDHLQNKGCPICRNILIGNIKRSSIKDFVEKARKVHGDRYDYSKTNYTGVHDIVQIICPEHGEFNQEANSHLHGIGCPKCRQSHGEAIIRNIMEEYYVKYQNQYRINISKTINSSGYSYIDFYLPDFNIFIEYNGIQHYVPVEHFGGELRFKKQTQRDQYIKDYCKINNIKLLEIPYKLKDYNDILYFLKENASEIFIKQRFNR